MTTTTTTTTATKEYKHEVLFFANEKKDDRDNIVLDLQNSAMAGSTSFDANTIEPVSSSEDDNDDDDDSNSNNSNSNNSNTCCDNNNNNNEKYKVVKFADVEAEKLDAQRDQERSRQELLSKIAQLTDTLREAQQQIQVEKDKRKKKEKSLLKLAKELKKRNLLKERDEDRLEELEEKRKYLEHHWVLAQKELDQEKALHTKLHEETEKEYEHSIREEKAKFEKAVRENETRLANLKKAHVQQCEQLGKEAWKANLEADRLHEELTARGLTKVPRRLLDGEEYLVVHDGRSRLGVSFLFVLAVLSSVIYSYIGNHAGDIFTHGGLCAPLIPGTVLDDNYSYGTFRAPWWAPATLKNEAFTAVCTEGGWDAVVATATATTTTAKNFPAPPAVEWTRDGKNNKMQVLSSEGKVVLKRSVAKSQITSQKLQFWKRNGGSEEVSFDWLSVN